MPCLINPDMHHTWLCIMPCLCDGCLLCCLLLFGLLLSLASVSFRSCEGSFDYVRSSSSWSRSSSLWDFRQDDHHLGSHYYQCYASCCVLSLCCAPYHLFFKPPNLPCQPLTFFILPSKPLLGYVTALLNPSYSLVSCRWSWRLLHGGQDYVGISQYLLFN